MRLQADAAGLIFCMADLYLRSLESFLVGLVAREARAVVPLLARPPGRNDVCVLKTRKGVFQRCKRVLCARARLVTCTELEGGSEKVRLAGAEAGVFVDEFLLQCAWFHMIYSLFACRHSRWDQVLNTFLFSVS